MTAQIRSVGLVSFLSLSLFTAGCVHLRPYNPPRSAQPLPEAISREINFARQIDFLSQETIREANLKYNLRRVELQCAQPFPVTNIVLDYYQLRRDKCPVIVLLPISGGGYEAESIFARYFARRGFAVVLARRRKIGDETPTPKAINDWLREGVQINKRVLDWIDTRNELDPKRIGLFGISMGGIQAAILVGLDHRIEASTLGLAGGDLPFILSHSTEKSIAKQRKAFLRDHNMSLAQFQEELTTGISYDPVLLAPYVESDRVMMVLGRFDTVVPFRSGWELREKLGKPETVVLPTGHYSAALCIPYVEWQCRRFFQKRLR